MAKIKKPGLWGLGFLYTFEAFGFRVTVRGAGSSFSLVVPSLWPANVVRVLTVTIKDDFELL